MYKNDLCEGVSVICGCGSWVVVPNKTGEDVGLVMETVTATKPSPAPVGVFKTILPRTPSPGFYSTAWLSDGVLDHLVTVTHMYRL